MTDTMTNLVAENRLLRAQLQSFQHHFASRSLLRTAAWGARIGDQLICDADSYEASVAAVLDPVDTCIEMCDGRRPQTWIDCGLHLLVEASADCAQELVRRYPARLVLNCGVAELLAMCPDRSVDSVILRNPFTALGLERSHRALMRARRVARRQVIVLCTQDSSLSERNADGSFCGAEAKPIGDSASGLSIWYPEDLSAGTIVARITRSSHGEAVDEFVVVTDATGPHLETERRLVVMSDYAPEFTFSPDDVVVGDVGEVANHFRCGDLPVRTFVIVPLLLLRSMLSLPTTLLRSTIVNFAFLEAYVQHFPNIICIGVDAGLIVQEMRNRRQDCELAGRSGV